MATRVGSFYGIKAIHLERSDVGDYKIIKRLLEKLELKPKAKDTVSILSYDCDIPQKRIKLILERYFY